MAKLDTKVGILPQCVLNVHETNVITIWPGIIIMKTFFTMTTV